ncbi:unnamed protein product [Vitrella brassicaformis CCMP3155]|uniref:Uncharacterized protein n=1 Tax=Vitrella brassicaformis (strain CCMP3155) TaxID=1169540 RepID=A0A0G4EX13_VITBC|nr:unnamed protein product [Vitrella brassicaformis CCMP3155]|eukprot:CEM02624.1 unnamed protein product [Vitrella brassicaformis CCMP3155]
MEQPNKLVVAKLSASDHLRRLKGSIENIAEELNPALEPVLLKQTFKRDYTTTPSAPKRPYDEVKGQETAELMKVVAAETEKAGTLSQALQQQETELTRRVEEQHRDTQQKAETDQGTIEQLRAEHSSLRDEVASHQRRAEEAERVAKAAAEQKLKATLVELEAVKLLESSLRAQITGAATRESALEEQLREAHRQRREAQEQLREAHRQSEGKLRALQSQLDQGAEQLAQAEQTVQQLQQQRDERDAELSAAQEGLSTEGQAIAQRNRSVCVVCAWICQDMDDQRRESKEKADKDRSWLEQQINELELEFKKTLEALQSHNAHLERQLKAANQKHDEASTLILSPISLCVRV